MIRQTPLGKPSEHVCGVRHARGDDVHKTSFDLVPDAISRPDGLCLYRDVPRGVRLAVG
jgi:hypothetical protein